MAKLRETLTGDALCAASALKMALAGWNKGSQALLAASPSARLSDNACKAWRFVGGIDEIARWLAAVSLLAGFHQAAREIYRRLANCKDGGTPPPAEEAAARSF